MELEDPRDDDDVFIIILISATSLKSIFKHLPNLNTNFWYLFRPSLFFLDVEYAI